MVETKTDTRQEEQKPNDPLLKIIAEWLIENKSGQAALGEVSNPLLAAIYQDPLSKLIDIEEAGRTGQGYLEIREMKNRPYLLEDNPVFSKDEKDAIQLVFQERRKILEEDPTGFSLLDSIVRNWEVILDQTEQTVASILEFVLVYDDLAQKETSLNKEIVTIILKQMRDGVDDYKTRYLSVAREGLDPLPPNAEESKNFYLNPQHLREVNMRVTAGRNFME